MRTLLITLLTLTTFSSYANSNFKFDQDNPFDEHLGGEITDMIEHELATMEPCLDPEDLGCNETAKKLLKVKIQSRLLEKYLPEEKVRAVGMMEGIIAGKLIGEAIGFIKDTAAAAAEAAADVHKTKKEQEKQRKALEQQAIENGYYDIWRDAVPAR